MSSSSSSPDNLLASSISPQTLDATSAAAKGIGLVQGEFSCAWKNYNGTLLAGNQGVSFSGSYFLFETTLLMEWESIVKVQNYDETSGSLEILLKDGNLHTFRCLTEKSWLLLMTLHNDSLLLNRETTSETPRLRRQKSDPSGELFQSPITPQAFSTPVKPISSFVTFLLDELPIDVVEKSTGAPPLLHDGKCSYRGMVGRLYSGPQGVCFTARRGAVFWEHALVTIPWLSIRQIHQISGGVRIEATNNNMYNFGMPESNSVWASLLDLHNEGLIKSPGGQHRRRKSDPLSQQLYLMYEDAPPTTPRSSKSAPNSPARSRRMVPPEFVPNWESLKSQKLETVVMEDLRLSPCTVDKFFDTFISDDAPNSLSRFLEERGDTELKATPWNGDERVVRYMHPINAPLAPPEARARKEQHFERYGNKGMVLTTRTVVDDVPMTDCFYVADRILVERVDANSVAVRMEFEITFVKSTMFQGLIRKTTSGEFKDFFQSLSTYMSNAIHPQAAGGATPVKPTGPKDTVNARQPSGGAWISPQYLMIGVVLLVQLYILQELRDIKRSLRSLSARE